MLIHHLSFTLEVDEEAHSQLQWYQGWVHGDKLAVHHRVVVQYGDKQALAQSNHLQLELLMRLGPHQIWLCSENWPFIWPVAFQLSYDQKREAKQIGILTSVLVFQWSDTSINIVDHHVTLQQPLSLPTIYPQTGDYATKFLASVLQPVCFQGSARFGLNAAFRGTLNTWRGTQTLGEHTNTTTLDPKPSSFLATLHQRDLQLYLFPYIIVYGLNRN